MPYRRNIIAKLRAVYRLTLDDFGTITDAGLKASAYLRGAFICSLHEIGVTVNFRSVRSKLMVWPYWEIWIDNQDLNDCKTWSVLLEKHRGVWSYIGEAKNGQS